jgi:hypothetical protein
VKRLQARLQDFYAVMAKPLRAEQEEDRWLAAAEKKGCTTPWH